MTTKCSGYEIPVEKYGDFRRMLEATGGKIGYVHSSKFTSKVSVSFSFEDINGLNEWQQMWKTANTDIIEKRSDSGWRCFMRRNGLGFIEKRIGD